MIDIPPSANNVSDVQKVFEAMVGGVSTINTEKPKKPMKEFDLRDILFTESE